MARRGATNLLWMVTVLVVLGARAVSASPAAEVAAIHAVDDAWVKAYNSGQVDGVANLYEERAVLMPPGAPAASGRSAIRAFFAKDMAEAAKAGFSVSLGTDRDGGVSGDWGWSSGTFTVKDKTGKVVDAGKYLSVSRKIGGKWLYVRDTWNSDAPPAPQPAPMKQ